MSFGNKNPETKIKILFWIKKSRIENNTFRKKKSKKEIIMFQKWKFGNKNEKPIPNKKILNIKFRSRKNNLEHILEKNFKDSFVFSAGIGCSDMVQEAIAFILQSHYLNMHHIRVMAKIAQVNLYTILLSFFSHLSWSSLLCSSSQTL